MQENTNILSDNVETSQDNAPNKVECGGKTWNKLQKILISIIAVLTALCLVLGVSLGVTSGKLRKIRDREYAAAHYTGPVTVEGEMVPLYDSALGETAIPAFVGVPKSTYNIENIKDENGYKYYYENGEVTSLVGIDVSTYNGEIDFDAVRESGVDFVMVRVGGRGYGQSGVLYEDDMAKANLKGARKSGLLVGAYFFSQAKTVEEAQEEAEFADSIISGFKLDFPLAYDWEILSDTVTRIDEVTPEQASLCAKAFCDKVSDMGYTPMVYTNQQLGYFKFDLTKFKGVDIWYAGYSDQPKYFYNYGIWQYTDSGQVPGIQGYTDLNIAFKDYSK